MKVAGGCLCGEIRYEAREEPVWASYCHCGMCRKASGAPFMSFVEFGDRVFAWTQGEAERYVSSDGVVRRFCGKCGSSLTFEMDRRTFIALGSLDHPEAVEIQRHCYTRFRLPGVKMADGLPEFEGPHTGIGGKPVDWSPEQ